MTRCYFDQLDSPLGVLTLRCDEHGALMQLAFEPAELCVPPLGWQHSERRLRSARQQLREYFRGTRRRFDLALAPEGTAFQHSVWRALWTIPYGRTTGYGTLARSLGAPTASRAVGAANGRNPLPIVVPCHRVVGADGSLTGYAGGLDRKRFLLALEAAAHPRVSSS